MSSSARNQEYDPKALGAQIRDLRKAKRMTLTELAKETDRSVGNISEIERGMSAVTLPVLQEIAKALGVQVTWFFEGQAGAPEIERDYIVRKENRRILKMQNVGLTEELLSPGLGGPLQMLLTTYTPGAETGEDGRHRIGDEVGLILSGQLELTIEGNTFLLAEGDSFSLPRDGRHACKNPGSDNCVIAWVITPPAF